MELTSKQRSQLRGLANGIDTILHIGKDGIGENLIKQADDALEARELIKGRVLDNNLEYDARLAAEELAQVAVYQEFLPKPLTDEELTAEVKAIIAETGAASAKEMGKVMGVASKRLVGRVDGKELSAKVRELLA